MARSGKCPLVRLNVIAAGLTVALAAAGCTSIGDRAGSAADVVLQILRAVESRDGATACGLLAPETAAEVEQSAGRPCAEAILDEDLPEPAEVTGTEVYGQRAQVRLAEDTVFLGAFPGGWRVVAAGCTSRGEKPYDCTVQGG